jgi:hypothetical protein
MLCAAPSARGLLRLRPSAARTSTLWRLRLCVPCPRTATAGASCGGGRGSHCPRNSGNALASEIGCACLIPSGPSRLCAAVVSVRCVQGGTFGRAPTWRLTSCPSGCSTPRAAAVLVPEAPPPRQTREVCRRRPVGAASTLLSLPATATFQVPREYCLPASTAHFFTTLRVALSTCVCVPVRRPGATPARHDDIVTTSALWTVRCASVASRTGRCCAPCPASTSTTQVLAWQALPPGAHRSPQLVHFSSPFAGCAQTMSPCRMSADRFTTLCH